MVAISLRFPLGVYHAQSQAGFARPEWPPHPVRLIAALVAATHGGQLDKPAEIRAVVDRLARAGAPLISAPRLTGVGDARNDEQLVWPLRGASRWAPRNHELAELRELNKKQGISPRDLGRGRAEVHKVGVAVGDRPISFTWPMLELDEHELRRLRGAVEELTFLGTARSPVIADVVTGGEPPHEGAWRPLVADAPAAACESVRVPDARTLDQLDAWHERRRAPVRRSGAPTKAPLVVAPRLGGLVAYVHDRVEAEVTPFDPRHWGEMLVLALAGDVVPKAPASFALARATRKALLDTYAEPGQPGEAPAILRARAAAPHAAFVALSFVASQDSGSPAARHADGRVLGLAVLLPHDARMEGLAEQRADVVSGLLRLVDGVRVRVPGVGPVAFLPPERQRVALQERRYRRSSRWWTTITPVVHSRHRTGNGEKALLAQVTADCRDVGLPAPELVRVRRVPHLRGAVHRIGSRGLPPGWDGPLKGPQSHLDLCFERPVEGPVLLGRARHYGLGLCLPLDSDAEER